jgi:ribosomal protein S18 acetylase RimI-like enzyme
MMQHDQDQIRPIEPADTDWLVRLAETTNVFKPIELVALREVLDDYHATNHQLNHRGVVFERLGRVLGFAYYAPAAMTDRSWYLYWIAVAKECQGQGIGQKLMAHTEAEIIAAQGRILFVETSSLDHYEPTRRFYAGRSYELIATVSDYYSDDDDMMVFRKRLEARNCEV